MGLKTYDQLRGMSRKEMLKHFLVCASFIVLCMGGGGIMGALSAGSLGDDSEWYQSLKKPCWQPPSWLFGPVWSILYLLMAIAAYVVWTQGGFKKQKLPLGVFFAQLALNFLWIVIFAISKQLLGGFIEIIILWFFIVTTMILFFRVKMWTIFLLFPYLMWVTFATCLNGSIYILNKETHN